MNRLMRALLVLSAAFVLAAASNVEAQIDMKTGVDLAERVAREQAEAAEKLQLARQVVQTREDLQQREPLAPEFAAYWVPRLAGLPLEQLREVAVLAASTGLEEAIALAAGRPYAAVDDVLAFGDSGADLVYTKVAPCRVADTRVAGGALGTGATRSFYVAGLDLGDFPSQGGTACAIPLGPATAVAMNITVVGASGNGWLRAYPYGGSGNASVINYSTGQTIANGIVMPICDPAVTGCARDLTVVADSYGGHVLIDVMGYWAKPTRLGKLRTFTVEASSSSTTTMLLYPGCTNYANGVISITVPGPGEILVDAKVALDVGHASGTNSNAAFGLASTSNNCFLNVAQGASYLSLPAALPSGTYTIWDTVRTRQVVTAGAGGTYYFYLNGYMTSGAGIRFYYAHMTATFHPD